MKITSVDAIPITYVEKREPLKYMFEMPMNLFCIRVHSDAGIVGYGEVCDSYGCSFGRSFQSLVEESLSQ